MARRFEETVNIQPQSFATGAAEAQMGLAQRLQGFKNQALQVAQQQAVQRGVDTAAGTPIESADVQGQQVAVAPKKKEKRFIGGIEIQSHNKTLQNAYLATLGNDIREGVANIALNNPADVVGFNEAVAGFSKGVLETVDPLARDAAAADLDFRTTSARIKVQANQVQTTHAAAVAETRDAVASSSSAAFTAARNGNQADAAENEAEAVLGVQALMDSGSLSTDVGNAQIREIGRETFENGLRHDFDVIFDEQGAAAAYDQLEQASKKVPKGFTPDEWRTYIGSQQTDLNQKVNRTRINAKIDLKALELKQSVDRGELFLDPNIPANPAKSGQDRKDVNAYFDEKFGPGIDPANVTNEITSFVADTGIVPDSVISTINATMRSGTVDQVLETSDLVARISELPNSANALRDLPDESRALSIQIADSVKLGIEPEIALEIARKNTYGQDKSTIEKIRIQTLAVTKELPDMLKSSIEDVDEFENFFGRIPNVPIDMQADYNVAFDRFMTLTDGSPEQSALMATDAVKKSWAVTEIGGPRRFQRFTPEAYYSVPGIDDEWMENQFNEEMEAAGHPGAILGVNANTGRSPTPAYPILITNENGLIDVMMDENQQPMEWQPDVRLTPEYQDLIDAPGKEVENAKKRRESKLLRKANNTRRKIIADATRAIPFAGIPEVGRGQREEFLQSEEGKARVLTAINNMNATGKLDDVEAQLAGAAFGVEFIPLQERVDALR